MSVVAHFSFMKRFSLLCLALLSCAAAQAEWLTLRGTPGDADNSYVQVDPTSVVVEGQHRTMAVRLSVKAPRTTKDNITFRSFTSRVNVDCDARSGRYASAVYYAQPNFVGDPIAVRVFDDDDVRPMAFAGSPPEVAARTVAAACGVGARSAQ